MKKAQIKDYIYIYRMRQKLTQLELCRKLKIKYEAYKLFEDGALSFKAYERNFKDDSIKVLIKSKIKDLTPKENYDIWRRVTEKDDEDLAKMIGVSFKTIYSNIGVDSRIGKFINKIIKEVL